MWKKTVAIIVLGIFFIIPFQVQAEELENERKGLLSKTGDPLLSTTENLVNTVQTTVHDVEKSIPVINPVTDVVSEVGKITLPIVEDVVIGVTDTTETVLTEAVEGVDKTVNKLPVAPVVTPILTTTTQTLGEVVSEVQTVVNSSEETVKNVVDIVVEEKDRNPIVETKKNPTMESTPGNQPIVDLTQDTTNLPFEKENFTPIVETNTPIDVKMAIEPDRKETTLTEVVADEELRVPEKDLEIYLNNMEVDDPKITQDDRLTNKAKAIQNKEVKVPVNPFIPLGPEPQMKITSGITWYGQGNTFSSSGSFLSTGNDILLGFLPSEEMLKELTKKKWYHKNSYAIIQWIHTPLRKPPELTPFLYMT